ncbi:MAG: EAL domain-containing protein [Methylotetracoccus sp.]
MSLIGLGTFFRARRFDRCDAAWALALLLTGLMSALVIEPLATDPPLVQPDLMRAVGLAALLRRGVRLWPWVAVSAAVSASLSFTSPVQALLGLVGDIVEPVAATALLRSFLFRFDRSFAGVRDYLGLLLAGGGFATVLGASFHAFGDLAAGAATAIPLALIWGADWMSGAVSVAALTPALLVWTAGGTGRCERLAEAGAAFSLLAIWAWASFGDGSAGPLVRYGDAFTLFPLLSWIGYRLGLRMTTLAVASVALLSWGCAIAGRGPFAADVAASGLRLYGLFASGLALTSIIPAILIEQRRRATVRLRRAACIYDATRDGVMISGEDGRIVAVNPAFSHITGYEIDEVIGGDSALLYGEQPDPDAASERSHALKRTGFWGGEVMSRRKSGEVYPQWQTVRSIASDGAASGERVTVFSDVSQIKLSEEKLHHMAHHDLLTGLPNRRLFRDRLEHAIQRADRSGSKLAVLFLDLDRFKDVNDSLGHTVGDSLLRQVANRLKAVMRRDDTLARLGGDEFTVLMEGLQRGKDASNVAEKLVLVLGEPFPVQRHELFVGVSIGISIYPQDAQSAESLLRNADAAMYRAKEAGRNTFWFYSEEMTIAALERVLIEAQLRRAIEQEELVLHYQPQVDLVSGEFVGVEAFVRWTHPEKGLIPPARFIRIAEQTGLIVPLGEWVIRTACTQCKAWLDAGLEFGTISVNVSAAQVLRGTLRQSIEKVLADTGFPANRLVLEISESFIMQQPSRSMDHFISIRDLGVMMAIDDFGTGHSSLSYLKRLPIDKLKIDRSFIQDLPNDSNDAVIARAVIALGHSLQFRVIAEGVENEGQRDFLRGEGCDEAQGYLYSRPMDAAATEQLLRATPAVRKVRIAAPER